VALKDGDDRVESLGKIGLITQFNLSQEFFAKRTFTKEMNRF